jgi:hypothetical protein
MKFFFSETCAVTKDAKLLITLSNCEHKKYAIADIFPRTLYKIMLTPKGFVNHSLETTAVELHILNLLL